MKTFDLFFLCEHAAQESAALWIGDGDVIRVNLSSDPDGLLTPPHWTSNMVRLDDKLR